MAADIVLAIGTSHSPLLNSPAEDYPKHATIDAFRRKLLDKQGHPTTYGRGGTRVGILASGGLSHFTVDEELDRGLLDACKRNDGEALSSIPVEKLNSGSSEIRNWITVAGAASHLKVEWQEYIPCYRSAAGTGCGMGFSVWR